MLKATIIRLDRWLQIGLYYLFALGVTALSTAVLYLLRGYISTPTVSLLFLVPVGVSTTLWGLGPGVLAALTSFLAFNYFFIPPYLTLFVHQTQDLLLLFIFLGVSIFISQLVGQAQLSRARATAREIEAIRMYELSNRLTGLRDEGDIALAIAEQTMLALQADGVDVHLALMPPARPIQLRLPPGRQADPDVQGLSKTVVAFPSAQGDLGELRIWHRKPTLTPVEKRLLQAYASQGVLALERSRLAQSETRARVLEESDRLKSSLLSSVSHELRTPLATIKASVSSLRSEGVEWDPEARADLLAAIEEETDNLTQLVSNLLNMARIEAGALHPQRSWNSLADIAASALNRMRQQTTRHEFAIQIPEDLPLLFVDYFQIEQVFTNLVSNSIKYSPEGSTIGISAAPQEPEQIEVAISNQGPPVPEQHLERIFDKFYRLQASERVTGAGLGLSICKGIIEAHGGKIWGENRVDGFTFHFTLPSTGEGAAQGGRRSLPEE